ncbi:MULTISPECIES: ATP-binding protein [unclassified Arthrobacter]|uniref:ATP-binding protein n=1 Tax=unclassified Arthrobacter TaxID=235627 RepID=UPI002E003F62|nr:MULTISPECIES: ATP-binding protein [unclassified Arthrobacter]MEC5193405.1 DNA helicase HerA-like ATPase [Arthrobacter sp. MP_M4]MEC5204863.1 DNA helicase HerA-like ATPase [Arthrobacter sp. MP_M7]
MGAKDETYIGRVRHVLGSQITVALDPDLAGIAPIYKGQLQQIGQIGSLVRLPQGMVDLIATVTLVGISELTLGLGPRESSPVGERWLQVQLLGEIDRGTRQFRRGVGSYPGLDDQVHFARTEELEAVYPNPSTTHIRVGRLSSSQAIPVALDVNKLVVRHSAVVGSTGSGKTSAVASLLQGFSNGHWPAANIVVIDSHGEYGHALAHHASIRSVLGSGESRLHVPFWALPAVDILRVFAGSSGGPTTQKTWTTLVADARREFVISASWLHLNPSAVTADTPVPFDIRKAWLRLDSENRETRRDKQDPSTVCVEKMGSAETLTPNAYLPNGPGGKPPMQNPMFGTHGSTPELLRLGLLDPRLAFLLEPSGTPEGPDPLVYAVDSWIGGSKPVSVLDFNGVPDDAAELAIGVILKLLFDVAIRTPNGSVGIGRPNPVLIVLEEAHRYLGDGAAPIARNAANKIAREGRKYGIGLMLVTQRPSDLPDTALAQCGTIIALRLSNSADQGKIRMALPDSVAGLAETLPSLRTGEAIISGEGLVLPTRALLDRPDPLPLAEDPSLDSWRNSHGTRDIAPALARWRGIYEMEKQ